MGFCSPILQKRLLKNLSRSVCGVNTDLTAATLVVLELNDAIDKGKQGVIATTTNIIAGVNFGAPLTDEDAASGHGLATIAFYTESLGAGVAAVSRTTSTFLMCHGDSPVARNLGIYCNSELLPTVGGI